MRLCFVAWAASALASPALAESQDAKDLATLSERRVADLAEFPDPLWFSNVQKWIDTQKSDGTWSDVNYLSGCSARRANWPIQEHWNRIITLAAAWSGTSLVADRQWTNSTQAWDAISHGLDYWFKNDYEPASCMGDGGNSKLGCPCGTPGLWNTNWYDQAILIPQLSSTACLLAKSGNLSEEQREGCIRLTKRTYENIDSTYGTGGRLTAANIVLVLQSAVSLGLFTNNVTTVEDAMKRAFSVMKFSDRPMEDGIHRDGSFLQHVGILYNGNYGKDLLNIFIQLEGEAVGTRFAASDATRETMATYIRGDEWMIFTDEKTRQQHWDYNVVGRFVSYPTSDLQANADINFNVTKLARAVVDFQGLNNLNDTITRLASNGTDHLIGNKGFWASDYMVHRRDSFVLGNKMLSKRSANSELVNGANTLGYHLGQGTLFTYVDGTEYKDIWASWDWNLIPGTTIVHDKPKISATRVKYNGKKDFVGSVSDGHVGVAVEDYVDPFDGNVSYKKAWFYLGDAVLVTVSDVKTKNVVGSAPVITVLDNRAKADGGAFVDGKRAKLGADTKAAGSTLFYGGNGYLSYGAPFDLTLSEEDRTGNWSAVSTSKEGLVTKSLFSAYTAVNASKTTTYALFPATSQRKLAQEAKKPSWIPVEGNGISAAAGQGALGVVFWSGGDSSISVKLADIGWANQGTVTLTSTQPGVFLLTGSSEGRAMKLHVSTSDPTQKRKTAELDLVFTRPVGKENVKDACQMVTKTTMTLNFKLPKGGMAGSSVQQEVNVE